MEVSPVCSDKRIHLQAKAELQQCIRRPPCTSLTEKSAIEFESQQNDYERKYAASDDFLLFGNASVVCVGGRCPGPRRSLNRAAAHRAAQRRVKAALSKVRCCVCAGYAFNCSFVTSSTSMCPGAWVATRQGSRASAIAAWGVTPHAQNTHTSPSCTSTASP